MASSPNLTWPPPVERMRVSAPPILADAVPPISVRRPWYTSLIVTVAAFAVFPPLGLVLALRYHKLWQRPLWMRVAVITLTVALTLTFIGVGASGDDSAGPVDPTDGSPATELSTGAATLGLSETDEEAAVAPSETRARAPVGPPLDVLGSEDTGVIPVSVLNAASP